MASTEAPSEKAASPRPCVPRTAYRFLKRAFGENARSHPIVRGISQEALAEIRGYHRTCAGVMARREHNPSLLTGEAIAAVVGEPPLTLLMTTN